MKLTTPVTIDPQGYTLHHGNYIMLLGSCFTESMGRRLETFRFPVLQNPFGILYNPLSIAEALERCLDNRPITSSELVLQDGLWHSWLHHGSFSRDSEEACLQVCNDAIRQAHDFLRTCDRLLVTFGSAWYFESRDNGLVVGNCHKVPSSRFVRKLATVEEILLRWRPLTQRFRSMHIEVLFTVSPVRHWAYGAHGNQVGKAPLFLSIEQLCVEQPSGFCYFPAYEILMDELRDYRFYADDLLHPSTLSEEIIWQRLQAAYMTDDTLALCDKIDRLDKLQGHRILHATPEAQRQQQIRIDQLSHEVEEMIHSYNKTDDVQLKQTEH